MECLHDEELKSKIEQLMDGFEPLGLGGQKYDFHMSDLILKAKYRKPIKISELSVNEQQDAVIQPGETVFVTTKEYLKLPKNISISLSPKRKFGHDGIIVLGGMHVDPGYHGQLYIGLYNFSTQDFILQPDKKLIGGLFFKHEEDVSYTPEEMKKDTFPEDLLRMISKYSPVNTAGLLNKMDIIDKELKEVEKKLNDDEEWKRCVREDISKMMDLLKAEQAARDKHINELRLEIEKQQGELKIKINNIETTAKVCDKLNGKWISVMGIFIAVLGILVAVFAWIKPS